MKWYLGIDVRKECADFALFSEDLLPVEDVLPLDDTKQGHDQLVHSLGKRFKRYPGLQIDCGVESTGGYENNWYALLLKLGSRMPIRTVRLNPSVVKNASKALLNANKTDAESAREIAGYLKRYADQVTYTTEESAYVGYRSLYNHLDKVRRQKTEMINARKQLLYSNFPELDRSARSGVPAWVLDLLMRYPTSAKLRRAKAVHLAKIKGLTVERAQLLIDKAKASVASHVGTPGYHVKASCPRNAAVRTYGRNGNAVPEDSAEIKNLGRFTVGQGISPGIAGDRPQGHGKGGLAVGMNRSGRSWSVRSIRARHIALPVYRLGDKTHDRM